jgi:hypothetical protein
MASERLSIRLIFKLRHYPRGTWYDSVVVATKPTNKAERSVAEPVEPRTGAKGKVGQQSTCRAQDRVSVSQALERMRQGAVTCNLSPNTRGRSRMTYQRNSRERGDARPTQPL